MITEDQSRVIAFLAAPATHGVTTVERIDTHASIVFLAGQRAYKLKRAVRYDYLDFSTVERRREMCEAEVHINRRTAPDLYVGSVAITETRGGLLELGGRGPAVDWVVEMVRFDQADLLDQRADAGALAVDLMPALGEEIARFHAHAGSRTDRGGWEAMNTIIDGNARAFAAEGAGVFDPERCRQLTHRTRFVLGLASDLLDARRDQGLVRQCHGDLHLRNVVIRNGQPTLFDAIEFNDDIACVDVLYDVAFLLMDLWRRHLDVHANAVWNAYLGATADFSGLSLMPLFLSCRAAVLAKTSATSATMQTDVRRRRRLQGVAREYLQLAVSLLQPATPSLVAIGGLSGSGKSTVAKALAPLIGAAPGAVVLGSDRIRKELARVSPHERLGPQWYTADASAHVYATLFQRADIVVRSGQTVIADAVFARPEDREAIQQVAAAAGVPFIGVWLEAPAPLLASRVQTRVADVSDADVDVVRQQLAGEIGDVRWHHLDGGQAIEHVYQAALALTSFLSYGNGVDLVTEASQESFPASDAPSWTGTTASVQVVS